MGRVIENTFKGWRFVALYNRKTRKIARDAKVMHIEFTKKRFFINWVKEAIVHYKVRTHCEHRLALKVLKSLQMNIELNEKMFRILKCCKLKYLEYLQKQVVTQWKKQAIKEKTERHLRRTVFKFMGEQKLKVALNGWRK